MNDDNKINQIRQEIQELYNRRQQLIEQSKQEQIVQEMPSDMVDNNSGMANSSSNTVEKAKALSLSNGHSILGDNKFNSGFVNMLIMALLAGFASGAIATAVYIFINLGKVTFNL